MREHDNRTLLARLRRAEELSQASDNLASVSRSRAEKGSSRTSSPGASVPHAAMARASASADADRRRREYPARRFPFQTSRKRAQILTKGGTGQRRCQDRVISWHRGRDPEPDTGVPSPARCSAHSARKEVGVLGRYPRAARLAGGMSSRGQPSNSTCPASKGYSPRSALASAFACTNGSRDRDQAPGGMSSQMSRNTEL